MEKGKIKLVLMGGSAGGLDAILKILMPMQQAPAVPIVIVLHRKPDYDTLLVEVLENRTKIPVKEAEEKEIFLPGNLYIAPADYHLLIEADGSFSLDDSEKVNYSRPSIDVSFSSAADVFGGAVSCILLSGANSDGTEGLRNALAAGADCIVQNPETAEVGFMPENAIRELGLHQVMRPDEIAQYILQL